MENNDALFELGKVALQKQSAYLKLKIEKELTGSEPFDKEEELNQSHTEWLKASNDYRAFIDSLKDKEGLNNLF